jgi:hypothetical protein
VITKVEVFGVHRAPALSLGGFMPSDDPVNIHNIEGLGPVKAEIATTPSGTARGETYQGSSTGKRNIVLTLGLSPNWSTQTMSSLRNLLYAYFMTQQWCKLRFYSDELPTTDIEGYVESFDPNMFSQDPEIQVSIINEKPDFIEIDATIYKGTVDLGGEDGIWLEVDYEGTVSSGLEIRVDRSVDNPAYSGPITISVENFKGVQTIVVDPVTIDTVKSFKMSSVHGQKRVQNETIEAGLITNLIKNMSGVWPELQPGENLINVKALEAGQTWTLAYFNRFGGL